MTKLIFTIPVLKSSSVTGTLSNMEKKIDSDTKPKPKLDSILLQCVKSNFVSISSCGNHLKT